MKGAAMINVKIDIIELIDLQSALRRASRYTEDTLDWAKQQQMGKSIEIWERDLKNFQALHQKLEKAFDAVYPPPKKETAA